MYIWNLRAMRGRLRAGPLPQTEQIPYVIGAALFGLAIAQHPFYGPPGWNLLVGAVILLINGLAIYYVYRCNGGSSGERFLERYVCLGWILMVRFFLLISTPLYALMDAYRPDYSSSLGIGFAVNIGVLVITQLLFYWLLGKQLRAVARPAI